MGYEINTTWKRMRKDDIERLNQIIDDEYCNELEIGRKLNIMKKFNEEFEKEIKNIYWSNILDYMKTNNWTWYMGGNFDNYGIPTKGEMIERLKTDFLKHGLYEIIELGKDRYSSFSGGFNVEMGIYEGNYYVHICFDIAHFTK